MENFWYATFFTLCGVACLITLVFLLFDIKIRRRDHHKEFYETFSRETEMTSDEILDLMNETKKNKGMKKATKMFKGKK